MVGFLGGAEGLEGVALRPFRWGDVPAITDIYAHYVANSIVTFDTEAPSEAGMAEKFGALLQAKRPLLVAERAGLAIGYAYAGLYRPRPAYRFTCENSIYLHKDETGRGLGRVMLERLIAESQAAGLRQMIAVIAADAANSVALHARCGFSPIGRHPAVGYKFDRWLDIVHMQRAL